MKKKKHESVIEHLHYIPWFFDLNKYSAVLLQELFVPGPSIKSSNLKTAIAIGFCEWKFVTT